MNCFNYCMKNYFSVFFLLIFSFFLFFILLIFLFLFFLPLIILLNFYFFYSVFLSNILSFTYLIFSSLSYSISLSSILLFPIQFSFFFFLSLIQFFFLFLTISFFNNFRFIYVFVQNNHIKDTSRNDFKTIWKRWQEICRWCFQRESWSHAFLKSFLKITYMVMNRNLTLLLIFIKISLVW